MNTLGFPFMNHDTVNTFFFDWPESTLFRFLGADNMDETWDDHLSHVFSDALDKRKVVWVSEIDWPSDEIASVGRFRYLIKTTLMEIGWQEILEQIGKLNLSQGIEIYVEDGYGNRKVLYSHPGNRKK